MFNKKFMILAIFLVGILAISAVSAEDNATSDIVGVEDANDDVIEQVNDDAYGISDDFRNKTTFGGLVYNLDNISGNDVYLNKDYKFIGAEYQYDPITEEKHLVVDENGINITSPITVHGNGHIIDGANASRLFLIQTDNVVLKDIVFVNSKVTENSPIIWNGFNGTLVNCTFSNCVCDADGGVINWVGDKGTVIDCDFTDCYARNAGAILWNGNDGTISNCNFDNCTPRDNAGSIKWVGSRGTVTDCTFANCHVVKGIAGAILWEGADGTVTNSDFANMAAESVGYRTGGGSIYWSGINGVISNSNFANSSINWNGGAINLHNVSGTVDNCTFFNCTAGSSGGAVYLDSANCRVSNSNFTKCEGYGAGIHCNDVNAIVDGCNFFNSFIDGNGGTGSVLVSSVNCSVLNSNFVNCNTTGFGSAIHVFQSNGTVANCTFYNCSAYGGGAIDWSGNYGIISGCNFTNCYSTTEDGGAVSKRGAYNEFSIFNSNFINCSAARNGGAVLWGDGNGNVYTLNNSNFINCSAYNGGAIYGDVKAYNSKFDECSAEYGGAMFKGAAINCTFTANRAKYGGAKHSTNDPTINCTFISNHASDYGGALYGNNAINCTFIDNSANNTGGAIQGVIDVLNCNFTNCYANVSGGAINGVENVKNSNFNNCHVLAEYGGAVYMNRAGGLIDNCNFTDCSSNLSGGAIAKFGNGGDICNSNFFTCAAGKDGGAIYHDRRGTIANCTFTDNVVAGDGGAVNGAKNAVNCSFNGNCANRGGALARSEANNCTFWDNIANDTRYNNWYDTRVPDLFLNVDNFNSVYGSGDAIYLNATDNDGIAVDDVILTIGVYKNDTLVETLDCLTNTEWVVDLDAGSYLAKVAIEHHAYKTDKQFTLTIAKLPTNITSSDISTVYNKDDFIVVTLKDANGNPLAGEVVSVDLNGVINCTTDENGTVKVSTKGVDAGNYTVALTYAGADNYVNSSASVNVTVEKAGSVISANAVTTTFNGGGYLTITLSDEFGNPISGEKVSARIVELRSATTDKDGKAKFSTDGVAPVTSYNAKIQYVGYGNYLSTSKVVKVTIKKAAVKLTAKAKTFKRSIKTKKYTITLKNNQNKVMKNTKVTLKVNKKTYTAKTNSKGQATFKITKLTKKGKYTATVKYAGSKLYNTKSVKVKITIK